MAQNWDEVLYPPFRATIRGEYYGVITQDHMDEECYNIACRAIAAFKFPKISTEYTTYYANWNETSGQYDITTDTVNGVPHGSFINTLTFNELDENYYKRKIQAYINEHPNDEVIPYLKEKIK